MSRLNLQNERNKLGGKNVWRGVAMPREELLMWSILLERLHTKDRLYKLKCFPSNDILCVFCSEEIESIEHVFFGCRISMKF